MSRILSKLWTLSPGSTSFTTGSVPSWKMGNDIFIHALLALRTSKEWQSSILKLMNTLPHSHSSQMPHPLPSLCYLPKQWWHSSPLPPWSSYSVSCTRVNMLFIIYVAAPRLQSRRGRKLQDSEGGANGWRILKWLTPVALKPKMCYKKQPYIHIRSPGCRVPAVHPGPHRCCHLRLLA